MFKVSESLTHRFAVPPLPQAGEGCYQLIFRSRTLTYKLQGAGQKDPRSNPGVQPIFASSDALTSGTRQKAGASFYSKPLEKAIPLPA